MNPCDVEFVNKVVKNLMDSEIVVWHCADKGCDFQPTTDWKEGGWDIDQSVELARRLAVQRLFDQLHRAFLFFPIGHRSILNFKFWISLQRFRHNRNHRSKSQPQRHSMSFFIATFRM